MRAGRKRIWLLESVWTSWERGERVVSMYLYDVCEGAHLWRQMGWRFAADKASGSALSRCAALARNRRRGNVFCIDMMI